MLQFKPYPIYILYSLHRQQAVDPLWQHYSNQRIAAREKAKTQIKHLHVLDALKSLKDYLKNDELIDGIFQWQLIEDLEPKYHKEIHDYETTIERILKTISHTSIGNSLLGMLNQDAKIFIIPATWDQPLAKTTMVPEVGGGGIRIEYNPSAFRRTYSSKHSIADETEDTLFHELVHAMRYSQNRFAGKRIEKAEFNFSLEEFIATQFENIFHSARRRSDIYGTYNGAPLTKKAMYDYFINDAELMVALSHVMHCEPLAKSAAVLQQPEYNPFRDFKEIEKKSLKVFGIPNFPDL